MFFVLVGLMSDNGVMSVTFSVYVLVELNFLESNGRWADRFGWIRIGLILFLFQNGGGWLNVGLMRGNFVTELSQVWNER